jgi:16S rRNA processing protein RimM
MEDLVVVGRVARAHGTKGQVIVNPDTDFAEEGFKAGAVVLVGAEARARVIRSARFHQGRPVIALEGIETMTDAEDLAGAELRIPASAAQPLPPGTFYHYDLIGCAVEDTAGRAIGPVKAIDGTRDLSRLVVAGERGDVLIPMVAHICTSIDVAARRIVVDPPEGLVDLNAPAVKS